MAILWNAHANCGMTGELGMTSTDEPWRKYAYDYEAFFYKAAGGKKYDIFSM